VKFEKKYYKYTRKTKKEKIVISDLLSMILSSSLDSEPTILLPKLLSSSKKHRRDKPSINILLIIEEVRMILDYYKGTLTKKSKH
jgi:hypothetical protein